MTIKVGFSGGEGEKWQDAGYFFKVQIQKKKKKPRVTVFGQQLE